MKINLSDPGLGVLAEIVNRAASPGYDDWWAKVAHSGFCAAPVRLARDDSARQPEILARCKNRRASVCSSCSQLYAGDTWQLVHGGIALEAGPSDDSRPMVFATLTAPSFGRVHTVSSGTARACSPVVSRRSCRHGRPSSCVAVHRAGDAILGEPLCPDCYDYLGHVLFTWHAPELWHRFAIGLRRHVARLCRDRGHDPGGTHVSYLKVVEMQRRALPHFHTILRLDHDPDSCQNLSAYDLAQVVLRVSQQVSLEVAVGAAPVALRFGEQVDVQLLAGAEENELVGPPELSGRKVSAYLAKYVTKSVGDVGITARRLHPGVIDELDVSEHVRRILHTIVDLARQPDDQAIGAWLHTLGYRGHITTKTRRYSTTMGALRARREAWRKNQNELLGPDKPGDGLQDTMADPTEWRYLGCGHATEGERFLASSAAGRVREARQVARDELR